MAEKVKSKYAGVYYVIASGPGGRGSDKKFYFCSMIFQGMSMPGFPGFFWLVAFVGKMS